MRSNKLFIVFLVALASLATACPNVNKPYPERTYFLFDVTPPAQKLAPVKGATVDINRFSISPRSEGREFIYRTTDLEYKSDFYNQFFRPPNNIMTEVVRQWLEQAGLFEDVLAPVSQAIPNYTIEGNIVELYGDYRNQSAAKAVMSIQFFFLRMSTDGDDPDILIGQTYSSEVPIGVATPQNLMNGYNQAFSDILNEFLKDLSYHIIQVQGIALDQQSLH